MSATDVIEWLVLACAISVLLLMFLFGAKIVWGAFTGRFEPLDLILGKTGRISDEKIWTHIGKALLVFAMLKDASDGHPEWSLQLTLFTALAAHEVVIRWMASREGPLKTVTTSTRVSSVEKTGVDSPQGTQP
jgi:hypothetical protein